MRRHWLVIGVVALLAVLWLQAPRLPDPFRVDEDFRTFYWMNRFYDPALFPDDTSSLYVDIWGVPVLLASPVYSLLFYAASFLVRPILFSKLLPFFVMPLTAWYLFGFGQAVRNRSTGLGLAIAFIFLNLATTTSFSVITGLQRSFSCLFVAALIYYLHRQNYIGAVIGLALSSLVYAPMFVLGAAIWGLFALKVNRPVLRSFLVERGGGLLLAAALLGMIGLSPALMTKFKPVLAPSPAVVSAPQTETVPLWQHPRYQADGISPLFYWYPFIGRGGLVHDEEDGLLVVILLALSGLIYLVRGRRAIKAVPYVAWAILLAALSLFILAWLALWLTNAFMLYLPSRYTQVGLFLFLVIFVSLNGRDFIEETFQLFQRHHERLIWLIVGVEAIVLGLLFLYPSERTMIEGFNVKWLLAPAGILFGLLGAAAVRKPTFSVPDLARLGQTRGGRLVAITAGGVILLGWMVYAPLVSEASFLNPDPPHRALYQFLATLPKDTLIGGTPCAIGSVPLFSRRQILFSCEDFAPAPVIRQALAAYYTDQEKEVAEFCQAQEVAYLVVDTRFYSEAYLAAGMLFFEPYNSELLPRLLDQKRFALAEAPEEARIFQADYLFVVPCAYYGKLIAPR